jgi:hypothetical protein
MLIDTMSPLRIQVPILQKLLTQLHMPDAVAGSRYRIDIFVKQELGCHPVAVVHYAFTNKQYTERHKQYIEQHKI